jgi:hypothetical protein
MKKQKEKGSKYGSLVTNQFLKEKVLLSALLAKLSNEHAVYRNTNDNGVFYIVENIAYKDTILLDEKGIWDHEKEIMVVDSKDMHL